MYIALVGNTDPKTYAKVRVAKSPTDEELKLIDEYFTQEHEKRAPYWYGTADELKALFEESVEKYVPLAETGKKYSTDTYNIDWI